MAHIMPAAIIAIVHLKERQMLCRYFKRQGFSAIMAGDAEKAFLACKDHPDAFIVLDAVMLHEIKLNDIKTPFLVLAGEEQELPTLHQTLDMGVRGVVVMPLPAPERDDGLKRCMELYHSERAASQEARSYAEQLQLLRQSLREAFIHALAKGRIENLPPGESFQKGSLRLIRYAPEKSSILDAEGWRRLNELLANAWHDAGVYWSGGVMEGCCYGLLCQTVSQAEEGREVMFWLGGMTLMEDCQHEKEYAGELSATCPWDASSVPGLPMQFLPFRERMRIGNMQVQEQREHRLRMQRYIKKGQHTHVAGYVARSISDPSDVWLWVPLLLEAVWGLYKEFPLSRLLSGFDVSELTEKGKTALIKWVHALMRDVKAWSQPHDLSPIVRVRQSILTNCSLPYSQSNLAESLGLTNAYFCRLFKKETGVAFSKYLIRTRMEHATNLLEGGFTGTLHELAENCGYANKSYFCRAFRLYTDKTVGEYRLMLFNGRDGNV